jgi:hypothetical protein
VEPAVKTETLQERNKALVLEAFDTLPEPDHPDLERFLAKRMGATIHEVDSSHVAMLSHPGLVVDVIRAAAKAVQGSFAPA